MELLFKFRDTKQSVEVYVGAFSGGLKSGNQCINPPVVDPPSQLRHSPSSTSSSPSSLIPLPSPHTPSHREAFPHFSLLSRVTVIFDVVTSRDLIFI